MRDAMRAIDDDDAVVGAFERRTQHVRNFGHKAIGGGHRLTRMHREDAANRRKASAPMVSKTFLQPRRVPPRRDMLNVPQKRRRYFGACGTYSAAGFSLCSRPATARTLPGEAC